MYRYLEQKNFAAFSEKRCKRLFKQLVDALNYGSKRGINHRDLKLENLIIINPSNNAEPNPEERLVIIDWGLCAVDAETKSSERWVGSPDYVAPEILLHETYVPEKADVWSLGVLLFILLTGKLPFHKKKRYSMLRIRQHPPVSFPLDAIDKLSDDAKNLIERLLEFKTDARIDLAGILKHPWLR